MSNLPKTVEDLIKDVYGARWGEAYLEWGMFPPPFPNNARAALAAPPANVAVFWSAGLLKPGAARGNAGVECLKVFVIDDVGAAANSRFNPEEIEMWMPEPTLKVESSPGNFQWQWGFTDGMDEPTMLALRRSLPWQSHATAMSNLIRLPMGVSGKPGSNHRVTGTRGPVYTAADFIEKCGGLKVPVQSMAQIRKELEAPGGIEQVKKLLAFLPNDGVSPYCKDEPDWFKFCTALHGATGGAGLDLWLDWCSSQGQKRDLVATWNRQEPLNLGWPSLEKWALQGSPDKGAFASAVFDDGVDVEAEAAAIPVALAVTPLHRTVAWEIERAHGKGMRFCHDAGCWYVFDGAIWAPQPASVKMGFLRAWDWVNAHIVRFTPAEVKAASKADFLSGVETILRQRLGIGLAAFDRDIWLLGTPAGTVDLKTGVLRGALPGDFISKSVEVAPAEVDDCPRWKKFVREICKGDAGSVMFLQQWLGYCLTGDTTEQKFLFLYGPGGNGKSVLMDTAARIMGGYFVKPVADLYFSKSGSRHMQEVAALAGARMITVSEVPSNAAWDEGKLKDHTGGSPVTANFMRQNSFTFLPQFKLTCLGNHQPQFPGGMDPAIKRRFKLMMLDFVPSVVDGDLQENMRPEAPGILRWMLQGLMAWHRTRLIVPQSVMDATDKYVHDQDIFGMWISDRVEASRGARTSATDLFQDWLGFRNANGGGDTFNNITTFGLEMSARGHNKGRAKSGMVYSDIRLVSKAKSAF